MENNTQCNMNIGCNVTECMHHSKNDDYCTLDKIQVVKHDTSVNNQESTDCSSFKLNM